MTNLPSQLGAPAPQSAGAMMTYDANKKSMALTYVLWFFLGGLGVHRFYLGTTALAAVQLALTLIGVLLVFVGIGLIPLAAIGIWLLVDLFLIPGIVSSHNNGLIAKLGG